MGQCQKPFPNRLATNYTTWQWLGGSTASGILTLVAQQSAVKKRCTADSATKLGNSTDTLGLLVKLKTPVPGETRAGLNHRLADSMPSVIQKIHLGVYFHYIWGGLVKPSHASV